MIDNTLLVIFGSIFVSNIVLSQFLGICSFLGVSKDIKSSLGMGAAVTFVMVLASAITWVVYNFALRPFELTYMITIAFILTIASLVQIVEMFMKKHMPEMHRAMGVFLPLITTNCAILGVALLNIQKEYSFTYAVLNGLANAIAYTLAMVLIAGLRERLADAEPPEAMKGLPLLLLVASSMAIAFMGFNGII